MPFVSLCIFWYSFCISSSIQWVSFGNILYCTSSDILFFLSLKVFSVLGLVCVRAYNYLLRFKSSGFSYMFHITSLMFLRSLSGKKNSFQYIQYIHSNILTSQFISSHSKDIADFIVVVVIISPSYISFQFLSFSQVYCIIILFFCILSIALLISVISKDTSQ